MKKILAWLCLAAMLCSLAACGKSNDSVTVPTGFQPASDTSVTDYTLLLPVDWTVNYQTGMTSAYYNEADPSTISLVTFDASEVADIDAYWGYTKQYSDVFGDPADVDIQEVTLDGRDARQYVYSTVFGEKEYKIWQVACLRAGRVYILSYVSTVENYPKHEEAMRAVLLDGFRFGTNG